MSDAEPQEHEAVDMPARWWSIQWVGVRLCWAILSAGLVIKANPDNSDMTAIAALVVAVAVLAGLTLAAHSARRRWAQEHA